MCSLLCLFSREIYTNSYKNLWVFHLNHPNKLLSTLAIKKPLRPKYPFLPQQSLFFSSLPNRRTSHRRRPSLGNSSDLPDKAWPQPRDRDPWMPAEGTKMKTRPWPGRWPLYGVMEKVKDVSNDLTVDEFVCFKGILAC